MLKLLTRLYQPAWGTISLHSSYLNELKPAELTNTVTCIEQSFVLFDGSVRDNILYGVTKDAAALGGAEGKQLTERAEAELEAAVDAACLRDDVESLLTQGLDTNVGTGGKKLSRGQQQRVAIARAWVRHAKIVIADEPVSGQVT
jgi:ABC-type multidrug transport system fused ATPase/permease subunit